MQRPAGEVMDAGGSIVAYEAWLESHDQAKLDEIEAYNTDDCRSTLLLRDWLEARRTEAEDAVRPDPAPGARERRGVRGAHRTRGGARSAGGAAPRPRARAPRLRLARRPRALAPPRGEARVVGLLPPRRVRERRRLHRRPRVHRRPRAREEGARREEVDGATGTSSSRRTTSSRSDRSRSIPATGKKAGEIVWIDDARGLLDLKRSAKQSPTCRTRAR